MRDYADYFNDRELPEKRGVEIHRDIDTRVAFMTRHFSKFLFAILLLLFVVAVSAVISAGKDSEKFPLKKLNITGDILITTPQDVNAALADLRKDSFLSIDLDEVSARLNKLPWIASASVTRSWPNTLTVNLVERQPVFRWGNTELVDKEGHRFANNNPTAFENLPKISGVDGSELEVIQAYQFLLSRLGEKANELEINEFTLNKHLSWKLHLKSGVVIIFGRNDYATRAARFAEAIRTNQLPNLQQLNVLDFRYNDGFAVKWKPEFQPHTNNGRLVKVRSQAI